jgi:hypothetical protein
MRTAMIPVTPKNAIFWPYLTISGAGNSGVYAAVFGFSHTFGTARM